MGTQSVGTDLVAEEKFSHLSSPLRGPISHFAESSRPVVQADPSSTPQKQEEKKPRLWGISIARAAGPSTWEAGEAFFYPLLKVLFSQLCQSVSPPSEVQLQQMSPLTSSRAHQQRSAGAPLGCSCLPSQLHLRYNQHIAAHARNQTHVRICRL